MLRFKRSRGYVNEGMDATIGGLVRFVDRYGLCDIDIEARTNFGIMRLVHIGLDARGLYFVTYQGDRIQAKDVRPQALVEAARQLGINEHNSRKTYRSRRYVDE